MGSRFPVAMVTCSWSVYTLVKYAQPDLFFFTVSMRCSFKLRKWWLLTLLQSEGSQTTYITEFFWQINELTTPVRAFYHCLDGNGYTWWIFRPFFQKVDTIMTEQRGKTLNFPRVNFFLSVLTPVNKKTILAGLPTLKVYDVTTCLSLILSYGQPCQV